VKEKKKKVSLVMLLFMYYIQQSGDVLLLPLRMFLFIKGNWILKAILYFPKIIPKYQRKPRKMKDAMKSLLPNRKHNILT